jgi:hypothetical protein
MMVNVQKSNLHALTRPKSVHPDSRGRLDAHGGYDLLNARKRSHLDAQGGALDLLETGQAAVSPPRRPPGAAFGRWGARSGDDRVRCRDGLISGGARQANGSATCAGGNPGERGIGRRGGRRRKRGRASGRQGGSRPAAPCILPYALPRGVMGVSGQRPSQTSVHDRRRR